MLPGHPSLSLLVAPLGSFSADEHMGLSGSRLLVKTSQPRCTHPVVTGTTLFVRMWPTHLYLLVELQPPSGNALFFLEVRG